MYHKYPRTFHLPWSLGTSSDDRIMPLPEVERIFSGKEIVVTTKLDGENISMYRDHIHARSLDSRTHSSQDWIRSLHGGLANEIPNPPFRIVGEYMYACHSIFYDNLDSYFYVFSIWDENNMALSWDDTKAYAEMLNLHVVPELYRGIWNADKVKDCMIQGQEGYVVRIIDSFQYPEGPFFETVVKNVREKHVQTDEHWRKTWIPNKLKSAS